MISEYIANVSIMNKLTTNEFYARLDIFRIFAEAKYSLHLDDIISKIKNKEDPYFLLTEYVRYLGRYNSTLTLKQQVMTVKNFHEYHDLDISPLRFKLKMKLPRTIRKNKEALKKIL
jgi:hypothetical protein